MSLSVPPEYLDVVIGATRMMSLSVPPEYLDVVIGATRTYAPSLAEGERSSSES